MKKGLIGLQFLTLALLLCGCSLGPTNNNNNNNNGGDTGGDDDTDYDDVDSDIDDSDYDGDEATGDFSITTSDGAYTVADNIYSLNEAGTYTLSGSLTGQIYVNVAQSETDVENEVVLELNGVAITYGSNSPIYCPDGDELKIKSINNTYNTITDTRSVKTTDVDTQGEGAIYAKCDLHFVGKGTLVVTGSYNNGVSTTDDLEIKNTTMKVTAPNNALKGNDSVEIKSGNLLLISTAGDGIKTENTDISSSTSKQRGTVSIYGGSVDIYAAYDAIDAAYDVEIYNGTDDDNETTIPVINAYTSNYSNYTGEDDDTNVTDSSNYISVRGTYSSSYRYATYWYDASDTSKFAWADCTYKTAYTSQGSSSYSLYSFAKPTDYNSFYVYRFASSVTTDSVSGANAYTTDGVTWNTSYDTYIVSVSGSIISEYSGRGSSCWGNYSNLISGSTGGGGGGFQPGSGGNTNKSTDSAKGIKADNAIKISGGKIYIKAYDDAIHANYNTALGNGSTGLGDVTISGGNVTVYASDDGIHADRYLNISGGTIVVTSSYEGLEANVINITGGTSTVYATDDGVNAANKAGLTVQILISGGFLDVTIASGDTDGIDSNGSYTQSGGIVITRGSPNSSSNMSTGLDTDGTAKVTGGSLICFGKPESTPSLGTGVSSSTLSGTYASGTYTVTVGGTAYSTTNIGSYSGVYIYSSVSVSLTKN